MNYSEQLRDKLENYFEVTTLHGLKYIGKPTTTIIEKLFWTISFVVAILFSGYFINKVIYNYNHSVIISENPYSVSGHIIPFPTITICNMNRAEEIPATAIITNGSTLEKKSLNILCNEQESNHDESAHVTRDFFINFTTNVSPSCEDAMKYCFWKNKQVNCSAIFNVALTDVGACCVFNQLSLKQIFRETNRDHFENLNFASEYGKNSRNTTTPLKLKGAGLMVVLDANLENIFCSSTNSVGFKIGLSNPVEMSLVKNKALHVPVEYQTIITLNPVISEAEKTLQHESYKSRWCFFNEERYLKYFVTYTLQNCITECNVNYTLEKCNCMPYYIMSNSTVEMCEYQHQECIARAKNLAAYNEKPLQNRSKCNCLPNCNEYNFKSRMSYNRLTSKQFFYMLLPGFMIQNKTYKEFIKSSAIIKVYFAKSNIERSSKNDLYDSFEFLSNMGGLLCIFLGFSFLSVVEAIYHVVFEISPIIVGMIRNYNSKDKNHFPFVK
ncbi:hypothetical protein FQR65_LT13091 [Abscondita terminalis]|nr:hypothetical protein FQR65_LT13091 [Abscondita terminalis]